MRQRVQDIKTTRKNYTKHHHHRRLHLKTSSRPSCYKKSSSKNCSPFPKEKLTPHYSNVTRSLSLLPLLLPPSSQLAKSGRRHCQTLFIIITLTTYSSNNHSFSPKNASLARFVLKQTSSQPIPLIHIFLQNETKRRRKIKVELSSIRIRQ